MLTCFYDLDVCPPKYDFLAFLICSEAARIQAREQTFRIVIVPGRCQGFREDLLFPRKPEDRQRMLQNVVLPMPQLLPCKPDIVHVKDREAAREFLKEGMIFPQGYTLEKPIKRYSPKFMFVAIKNDFYPLRYPEILEQDNKLITITLRESHYWTERNSNRSAWLSLADKLIERGFKVQIIPDIDSDLSHFEKYDIKTAEITDLLARIRLYSQARLNLFISNGPTWVAVMTRGVNCLVFKVATEGAVMNSPSSFEKFDFPTGSQPSRKNCRLVWEEDTEEVLVRETFRELSITSTVSS